MYRCLCQPGYEPPFVFERELAGFDPVLVLLLVEPYLLLDIIRKGQIPPFLQYPAGNVTSLASGLAKGQNQLIPAPKQTEVHNLVGKNNGTYTNHALITRYGGSGERNWESPKTYCGNTE